MHQSYSIALQKKKKKKKKKPIQGTPPYDHSTPICTHGRSLEIDEGARSEEKPYQIVLLSCR